MKLHESFVFFFCLFVLVADAQVTQITSSTRVAAQWKNNNSPTVRLYPIRNGAITESDYMEIQFVSLKATEGQNEVTLFGEVSLLAVDFSLDRTQTGIIAQALFSGEIDGNIDIIFQFVPDDTQSTSQPPYFIPKGALSVFTVINAPSLFETVNLVLTVAVNFSTPVILQLFEENWLFGATFIAETFGSAARYPSYGTLGDEVKNVTITTNNQILPTTTEIKLPIRGQSSADYSYDMFFLLQFEQEEISLTTGSSFLPPVIRDNTAIWLFILLILLLCCLLAAGIIALLHRRKKKKKQAKKGKKHSSSSSSSD